MSKPQPRNTNLPCIGVLSLDHDDGRVDTLRRFTVGGYEVAFANTLLSQTVLRHAAQDEAAASTIDASLDRAVRALRLAYADRLVALAADSLLLLCCAEAVGAAAGGTPVLPSAVVQAPLAMACVAPERRLLVLLDISGLADDVDEVTPHLLHHGLGLGEEDSSRVVVEAVQGCGVFAADRRGVEAALAAHVRGVLSEGTADAQFGAILLESPQLLPHADLLRETSGLPVFDALSVVSAIAASGALAGAGAAVPSGGGGDGAAAVLAPPSARLRRCLAHEIDLTPPPPPRALCSQANSVRVAAGDQLRVPLRLTAPCVLDSHFELRDGDIGLTIVQPHANGERVLASLRAGGRNDPVDGSVECEAGDVVVTFDNSYSWVRAKHLHYTLHTTANAEHAAANAAEEAAVAAQAALDAAHDRFVPLDAKAVKALETQHAAAARAARADEALGKRRAQRKTLDDLRAEAEAEAIVGRALDAAIDAAMPALEAEAEAAAAARAQAEAALQHARFERAVALRDLEALALQIVDAVSGKRGAFQL